MHKVLPSVFSKVCSRSFALVLPLHAARLPLRSHVVSRKSWAVLQQDYRYSQRWSRARNPDMSNANILFSKDFRALYWTGASTALSFLGRLSKVPAFVFTCKEVKWFIEWHAASPCQSLSFSALLPLLISCHGQTCLMFVRDEHVSLGRPGCYK